MIMLIGAEGCKHDVKWYTWFMLLKEKRPTQGGSLFGTSKEVTHLCRDLGPPRTDHLGVGHLWVTCAV